MKKIVFILLFSCSSLWAVDIPKSTENSGMNKYERINKIEKELIALAKRVQMLERALLSQRQSHTPKKQEDKIPAN